jgi:hypothetical protein
MPATPKQSSRDRLLAETAKNDKNKFEQGIGLMNIFRMVGIGGINIQLAR